MHCKYNATQIRNTNKKHKYKYKFVYTNTIFRNYKYLMCNLFELSPTNAASAPDRHIQPSGEEDVIPYFVHKYNYKSEIQNQIGIRQTNAVQICVYKYIPDHHIKPSGEEDARLYFVHKYKYKL